MRLVSGAFKTLKSLARVSADIFNRVNDLMKNGWNLAWDDGLKKLIFKDPAGKAFAEVIDNVMTFKYPHFGGDIITDPNKTTTVIGNFDDHVTGGGVRDIIDSGLSNSGENLGGLNVLDISDDISDLSDAEIWEFYNKPWLEAVAEKGDVIRLASDPLDSRNLADLNGDLTFFGMEVALLEELSYIYDAATSTFVKNN